MQRDVLKTMNGLTHVPAAFDHKEYVSVVANYESNLDDAEANMNEVRNLLPHVPKDDLLTQYNSYMRP
jgi:hypothetical protein